MPLIVEAAKRDLSIVVERGRQKMQDGAYDLAVQQFNLALEVKPGFMQALVSRGFCHLTLGDEEKAQRDFVEVINKDAGFNRNVYVLLALCCKRSGDFQTAVRYLNRCISQFPAFKAGLLARGELCLKMHDFERSRADFRKVLDDSPMHLVARRGLADALRGLGNFREALKQYQRAIADTLQALEHHQERQQEQMQEENQEDSRGAGTMSQQSGDDMRSCIDDEMIYVAEDYQGGGSGRLSQRSGQDAGDYDDGQDDCERSDSRNQGPSASNPTEGSNGNPGPEQLRLFLLELLMRRSLLYRLVGNLEMAGADLLEVLELEPQDGLALLWYAKVLIEQQRHQEAESFLQASIQHDAEIRLPAHALLGALLMSRPDPDFENAQRHLKEAARLNPSAQNVRVTLWICSAAVAVNKNPRDAEGALSLLDRALAVLEDKEVSASPSDASGSKSARGSRGAHVGGSGAAAAVALSARSKSAEEARWSATRTLMKRQEQLAQGDDLQQALQCRTFLQLVAREPQQRSAEVPSLVFVLRISALCDLCRWEEAVADGRRALVLDRGDEATQYTMHIASGILRSQASKFEAAIGCFTKAIRLQPVNAEPRLHRAIVLACAARAHGSSASLAHDAGRVAQLLTDAVQDLEAVDQQAMITGAPPALGAAHLRAACLCSLGRPDDAWEVLCDSRQHCGSRRSSADGRGDDPSLPRQRALEAEVLVLLRRHEEAIEACSAVLDRNSKGHTEARLMRAWCYSELGSMDQSFEDLYMALSLSPDKVEVHEACGDLCTAHGRLAEAYHAYGVAVRLSQPLEPRLAYKRALPQLTLGNLTYVLQELHRALRMNPHMPSALRLRDGANALQMVLKEDWRHAHVRLNMMLHQGFPGGNPASALPLSNGPDSLPVVFLPHELVMYRGVCSLYLGDLSTAIQDFASALELARQLATAAEEAQWDPRKPPVGLPPEVSSRQGLASFECECLYNVALCHLRARDYRAALASVERLLDRPEDLDSFGESAQGLIWFLAGMCNLALDSEDLPCEHLAREAFTRSYSFDSSYVDDFLRRHGQAQIQAEKQTAAAYRLLRPIGSCPVPPPRAPLREVCDAAPEAVCCLRACLHKPRGIPVEPESAAVDGEGDVEETKGVDNGACDGDGIDQAMEGDQLDEAVRTSCSGQEAGSSQGALGVWSSGVGSGGGRRRTLASLLPPLRLQVRDVVIWCRPSVGWPHVPAPEWKPPTSLARLDLLQQPDPMPTAGGRGGA